MKRIMPIIVILAAIGGGWWWWTQRSKPVEAGLAASGTIEARQVRLAAEVGGRIVELSAQEGEAVQAGQVLLRLDDSLLLAQRQQAEAQRPAHERHSPSGQPPIMRSAHGSPLHFPLLREYHGALWPASLERAGNAKCPVCGPFPSLGGTEHPHRCPHLCYNT